MRRRRLLDLDGADRTREASIATRLLAVMRVAGDGFAPYPGGDEARARRDLVVELKADLSVLHFP